MEGKRIMSSAPQNSPEWYNARVGKITSSNAKGISTAGKGSLFGDAFFSTALEVLAERLCNSCYTISSKSLEHGHEWEPEARSLYSLMTGNAVDKVGFIEIRDRFIGCSPDGSVGKDGIIEIKCPSTREPHTRLLVNGGLPKDGYVLAQMQHILMVTERKWCDFVSYHPDFEPSGKTLYTFRVTAEGFDAKSYNNKWTMAEYEKRVIDCNEYIANKMSEILNP